MRKFFAIAFILFAPIARADCELDRVEQSSAGPGLPTRYHVTCTDGRTGRADVDDFGNTKMMLYPSPVSHDVYPRDYDGRISGGRFNTMTPIGPNPNPRPRVQPEDDE